MEQRTDFVKNILKEVPRSEQKPSFLEYLSNYILDAQPKKERKERKIINDNRMVTIDKHETSFEGLAEKFEMNADGIYDLFTDNTNQYITCQKPKITAEMIAEVPGLSDTIEIIKSLEQQYSRASGKRKYLLKKSIIEFRRNQYLAIQSYYQPTHANAQRTRPNIDSPTLNETYDIEGDSVITGGNLSLGNPRHVQSLLCNYSELKQDTYDKFNSDMYYILQDLEDCIAEGVELVNPLYYEILVLKIDGLSNKEIHDALLSKFDKTYTPEYISCIWRQKIPKMIADTAKKKYIDYYYTEIEKGRWKRCSRCGQIKLLHPLYFSKNCTSKDGYYSICKECRNKRQRKKAATDGGSEQT